MLYLNKILEVEKYLWKKANQNHAVEMEIDEEATDLEEIEMAEEIEVEAVIVETEEEAATVEALEDENIAEEAAEKQLHVDEEDKFILILKMQLSGCIFFVNIS